MATGSVTHQGSTPGSGMAEMPSAHWATLEQPLPRCDGPGQQPPDPQLLGSVGAPGSHLACFDNWLRLLGLAKMKKAPRQGVPGAVRKQLRLPREPCPLSLLLSRGVTASWSGCGHDLAPGSSQELPWLTSHLPCRGGNTAKRRAGHTRGEDAEGKGLALPSAQHGQNDSYCEASQWLIWHCSQSCFAISHPLLGIS